VIVARDASLRGANWARNEGAKRARAPFLLFSDDDIEWLPGAIAVLAAALEHRPDAAYSFGSYELYDPRGVRPSLIQCARPFCPARLRRGSCISTMSLIRAWAFPGFDERIERLQDWDLFLTMLARGHQGVQCGSLIFRTAMKDGITQNGAVDWEDARRHVVRKHNLS